MKKKINVLISILFLFGIVTIQACNNANTTPSGIINPTAVTWLAPTTNTDDTPIDDGAGFKLYCGNTTNGPYQLKYDIFGWAINTQSLTSFTGGDWYCVMSAYDTSGNESPYSTEFNFSIDKTKPKAPINIRLIM